jgi:hypothetical protein
MSVMRGVWPCLHFCTSISNATVDLLMMAAWNLALESFPGEPIPVRTCHLRCKVSYRITLSHTTLPVTIGCIGSLLSVWISTEITLAVDSVDG